MNISNVKKAKAVKKIKRIVGTVVIMALFVSMLGGCGNAKNNSSTSAAKSGLADGKSGELRIAAQPYPLYTPVYVAYNLGYLKEELDKVGVKFTWDEYQSGPLVNEAVAAGQEDMGFMADLPAIIAKSSGQDIEIVSNVAYGEKGLAVLVKKDSKIKSVSDLKGKKVGYAVGSYAQHLLALLLDKAGLTTDDLDSVNLAAGDQSAALSNGEVDAIVIWEQFISKLTSDNTARVLADGTGVKRGNMITYFVKDYADKNPKAVEAYIKALNRADEFIEKNPEKASETVAENFGVDKQLMLKILKNFTYQTELSKEDVAEITAVKDFSLKAGIIQNDVDMNTFINKKYLDEVAK